MYHGVNANVKERANNLRYNNIIIAVATINIDRAGDNFAFMIADKDVIFHRLSKVDFLGDSYHKSGKAIYTLEYTYRDGDPIASLSDNELQTLFVDGLKKIGFVDNGNEITSFTLKRFPYAYVIYDLNHKANMTAIREYFGNQGVLLNGRFGNFEYHNMDKVIAESKETAVKI
jgi:protoporphyrinogen oxidase